MKFCICSVFRCLLGSNTSVCVSQEVNLIGMLVFHWEAEGRPLPKMVSWVVVCCLEFCFFVA